MVGTHVFIVRVRCKIGYTFVVWLPYYGQVCTVAILYIERDIYTSSVHFKLFDYNNVYWKG